MNFFRSMEIDPTCKFSPHQSRSGGISFLGSLHLDVFTQPRPSSDVGRSVGLHVLAPTDEFKFGGNSRIFAV
jgi:hypothetical protein